VTYSTQDYDAPHASLDTSYYQKEGATLQQTSSDFSGQSLLLTGPDVMFMASSILLFGLVIGMLIGRHWARPTVKQAESSTTS
jgi:hypothetical protein